MNYKKIQLIYDHLCDDISRMIFEKRLEYSLSGSYHKIDEMVNLELYRYGDSDILNRCMDWIRKNNIEKVSVFGAGNAGHQIVHILKSNKIPVEKVYDNNEKKWGDKCDGVPICSSKEISAGEYIIIGVDYYREDIMQQLQILGVERNNMFIPDALWKMGDCSQYFDKRIMKPSESEIFVDGGCLDGEDIIDIPLKILELNPNYKLYLRHYSFSDLETVLYAI